jgi:1A family penicillin-binding protein
MARKKPQRRPKSSNSDFYESLPLAITPPAALPETNTKEVIGTLIELGRRIGSALPTIKLPSFINSDKLKRIELAKVIKNLPLATYLSVRRLFHWIAITGLRTTDIVIYYVKTARLVAVYGFESVVSFTPPIASDLGGFIRRRWRAIGSRRAKAIYLSLLFGGIFAVTVFGIVTATQTLNAYASYISSPSALLAKKKTGTTILDRTGKVLFEGYGATNVTVVPLSKVPKNLINATLAAEDPGFYQHSGFSWESTLRAAYVDLINHSAVEGGSTLTQQLVKNALLTDTKTFWRKYQEVLLAMDLEHRYTKDQILDMYLNEIYYGEGASGIEAASQTYFHTDVQNLTLAQSAMLAGMPLEPSQLDPNVNTTAATGRRDYVLSRMESLGMITKADETAAQNEPIVLASNVTPTSQTAPMVVYSKQVNIQAPWFVFYVLDQMRAQYGDDLVEQGGLTVKTTLDLTDENLAENAIQNHISKLSGHNVTNGALISMDPKTGDILAMVGSVNYNAPGFGNVNVTLSTRQPGSSFKPIVYATAFEKGYNGATTVLDAPTCWPGGAGSGPYCPQNYDLKFHGVVTLRHALDNSLNIPAVKVFQFAGIPESLQTAHNMGITTLNDPSRYGLSLVLGSGDVRPIDMATVYGTLANNGLRVLPQSILSVTDRNGKNITKPDNNNPAQVLDPRVAYMLTSILSDPKSRLPEFPLNSPLTLDRPAAAKTGTTTDFRDNWTIGYTPQLVTAVWVGNNNNTPMQNVDGITGAAPIWHDYMEGALSGTPVIPWTVPSGIVTASVCPNGGIAQGFSTGVTEVFMANQVPTTSCQAPSPSPQPDQNNGNAQANGNGNGGNNGNGNGNSPDNNPTPPVPTPVTPGPVPTPITEPPFGPPTGN